MFQFLLHIDIYEKDLISIIHLLVAIVQFYKVPLNLPENLTVKVIVLQVSTNSHIISVLILEINRLVFTRKKRNLKK